MRNENGDIMCGSRKCPYPLERQVIDNSKGRVGGSKS